MPGDTVYVWFPDLESLTVARCTAPRTAAGLVLPEAYVYVVLEGLHDERAMLEYLSGVQTLVYQPL